MRALAQWSARSPVAANVLMILIFIGGGMSLMGMRREFFPEFSLDLIRVTAVYPGAAPEEIEESVCVKIEEAIDEVDGIRKVTSEAMENMGAIAAEVEPGFNIDRVYDDIKNKVDQIDTFPDDVEEPVIARMTIRRSAVSVALYGDAPERVLRDLAEDLKDALTDTEEISQVTIEGARDYEISVEVGEEALRRHGLSFDDVAQAVRRGSLDLPAGRLKTREGEILLRAKGQRYTAREYEDIPVLSLPDGGVIRLSQVATVRDTFEDVDRYSRFHGKPAIQLEVFTTGSEDMIRVVEAVKRTLATFQTRLPEGVFVEHYSDRSIPVRDRIALLCKNGLQGLALVMLALWLFIRVRLAFWVALGIPISFMGGLIILHMLDQTINMLSLFGFIMTLGIVVDDAIIVGENIVAHWRRGAEPLEAAIEGAGEVGWPVFNSIATSVVAFSALFFVSGTMGKFIAVLPTVVIAVLVVSLFEAFLILPAHLKDSIAAEEKRLKSRGLWGEDHEEEIFDLAADLKEHAHVRSTSRIRQRVDEGIEYAIHDVYLPILRKAVEYRYLTVALAFGALIVSLGMFAGGRLSFVLFPKVDRNSITAKVIFPEGTPARVTEEAIRRIEEGARKAEDALARDLGESARPIEQIVSTLGATSGQRGSGDSGGHVGEVFIELLPLEKRSVGSVEVIKRWRAATGEIAGAEQVTFGMARGGPGGDPIELRLLSKSLEQLEAASEELKAELANYPGVFDIRDDSLPGKWEIRVKARPEARTLGLTHGDIARQMRQAFYGDEAVRVQRGRDDVKVMVRYPESGRRTRSDLEDMRIRTAANDEAPFSEVAEVDFGRGYSTIRRIDGRRAVTVTADIDEESANAEAIVANLRRSFLPALMDRYPGLDFDLEGQARERRESLQSLLRGFGFALVAIFCLLAAQFRSYVQPVIVMCAIPISLTGVIWGHILLGMPLTLISIFGVVALSGVVVNDSLVLIDFINRAYARTGDILESVLRSGVARFRAIFLTSTTTVAGLAPLLLERSVQARFLLPMAVSLAFGLMAATVLTLLVTPCLYLVVADAKEAMGFHPAPPREGEDVQAPAAVEDELDAFEGGS